MKSLFMVLAATLAVASTAQAEVLLTTTRYAGFSPNPTIVEVSIGAAGIILKKTTVMRTQKTTVEHLGRLETDGLKKLVKQVSELNPKEELQDTRPDQPKCMDAPSRDVKAYQKGVEIAIFANMSCHDWEPADDQGSALTGLANGLLNF